MKSKIQDLRTKMDKYYNNRFELENRRQQWRDNTKELIYNTLIEINEQFVNLVWHVSKNETSTNLESVYWSMRNFYSGIIIDNKHIVVRPGYLNFAQLVNGKIIVLISYPYIDENIRPEIKPKVLGEYLPSEIKEELIIDMAGKFLDEINDWSMNLDKV